MKSINSSSVNLSAKHYPHKPHPCLHPPHACPQALQFTLLLTLSQITKSARLEDIRLTILNNLMLFHPESTYELAWGLKVASGYDSDSSQPQTLGERSRCARYTLIYTLEPPLPICISTGIGQVWRWHCWAVVRMQRFTTYSHKTLSRVKISALIDAMELFKWLPFSNGMV